jgi:phosphoglycolate phosphatase-like HAD superfamily hydrolase
MPITTADLLTKRHLVFDFDLTIARMEVDWSGWHTGVAAIYSRFDKNHGYTAGVNPHEFYNAMATRFGRRLIDAVKLFNADYESRQIRGFIPNRELIALIKGLKGQAQLYIYSSNSRITLDKALMSLTMQDDFFQIITRDDVDFLKPVPEGFWLINQYHVDKDSLLMIGDSDSDRAAAVRAGVDFLLCDHFKTKITSATLDIWE